MLGALARRRTKTGITPEIKGKGAAAENNAQSSTAGAEQTTPPVAAPRRPRRTTEQLWGETYNILKIEYPVLIEAFERIASQVVSDATSTEGSSEPRTVTRQGGGISNHEVSLKIIDHELKAAEKLRGSRGSRYRHCAATDLAYGGREPGRTEQSGSGASVRCSLSRFTGRSAAA